MSETEADKLRAELAAARAEIRDLKSALVTMCDVYSANRSEKHKVKAFRRHAAAEAPFSLAQVIETFDALEASEAVPIRKRIVRVVPRDGDGVLVREDTGEPAVLRTGETIRIAGPREVDR